jgi:hypothetical protein
MSRKYSQRGYQDGGREEPRQEKPPRTMDGPRSPKMTGYHDVMRCAMCGTTVELALGGVEMTSTCTNCKADLYSCRNCVSFDPGARFECRAGVPARVSSKTARNECVSFSARKTVEKKTVESRPTTGAPKDARAAFDALFKK